MQKEIEECLLVSLILVLQGHISKLESPGWVFGSQIKSKKLLSNTHVDLKYSATSTWTIPTKKQNNLWDKNSLFALAAKY